MAVPNPQVQELPALPILFMRMHANVSSADADFFKSQVYGTAKLLKMATSFSLWAGLATIAVGIALIAADYAMAHSSRNRQQQADAAFKARQGPHPV